MGRTYNDGSTLRYTITRATMPNILDLMIHSYVPRHAIVSLSKFF